jgi:hypothetical protein
MGDEALLFDGNLKFLVKSIKSNFSTSLVHPNSGIVSRKEPFKDVVKTMSHWKVKISTNTREYETNVSPTKDQSTSQLQPIQVGYSIPVFCCIAYIIARYFVPITGIGHSARTAIQQESHDTSFNVPYKKVGLMLNS